MMTGPVALARRRRTIPPMYRRNDEVIALYLQSLRALKRSDRTIGGKANLLKRLAGHLGEATPLTLATYDDLSAWQISLAHLDTGTVAGYIAGVRVFYRWLVRPMRILESSPAEDLAIPKLPVRKPRPVPEQDVALAFACCSDPMILTWLLLMRYAGLRCVEVARLQRDDVITDEPYRLHIHGKGGHERIVPVDRALLDALLPWMRRQGTIFLRRDGRPHTANNVTERVSDYLRSVGLTYTAHQLRHTFGTDAYGRTHDIRMVQRMLGHQSVATTQLYVEVDDTQATELAQSYGAEIRARLKRGGR